MRNQESLSCREANQVDLVDYLSSLGHTPKKVLGDDYWFLSPLRIARTPSFKVNRKLNLWYDHGSGKGGTFVDFGIAYFNCSVKDFLSQIRDDQQATFSFHPHISLSAVEKKNTEGLDSKIKIISSKKISDEGLINYLHQRKIPEPIANQFCQEIEFELHDKKHIAIGFKNDRGGFELRNKNFKGSSSPKVSKLFREDDAKAITVFEGFFDFLSFQTLLKSPGRTLELPINQSDFLILNSISFFEKNRQAMEQYPNIYLFLDRDTVGIESMKLAQQWSDKYRDQSQTYYQFKDLNEFFIKSEGPQIKQRQRKGMRF